MGLLRLMPPADPKNPADPKLKMPPSGRDQPVPGVTAARGDADDGLVQRRPGQIAVKGCVAVVGHLAPRVDLVVADGAGSREGHRGDWGSVLGRERHRGRKSSELTWKEGDEKRAGIVGATCRLNSDGECIVVCATRPGGGTEIIGIRPRVRIAGNDFSRRRVVGHRELQHRVVAEGHSAEVHGAYRDRQAAGVAAPAPFSAPARATSESPPQSTLHRARDVHRCTRDLINFQPPLPRARRPAVGRLVRQRALMSNGATLPFRVVRLLTQTSTPTGAKAAVNSRQKASRSSGPRLVTKVLMPRRHTTTSRSTQ